MLACYMILHKYHSYNTWTGKCSFPLLAEVWWFTLESVKCFWNENIPVIFSIPGGSTEVGVLGSELLFSVCHPSEIEHQKSNSWHLLLQKYRACHMDPGRSVTVCHWIWVCSLWMLIPVLLSCDVFLINIAYLTFICWPVNAQNHRVRV